MTTAVDHTQAFRLLEEFARQARFMSEALLVIEDSARKSGINNLHVFMYITFTGGPPELRSLFQRELDGYEAALTRFAKSGSETDKQALVRSVEDVVYRFKQMAPDYLRTIKRGFALCL
jgi:hypothetical protein